MMVSYTLASMNTILVPVLSLKNLASGGESILQKHIIIQCDVI